MNSLIRPHDVLRRLSSAHTAMREPSRNSGAAWLSHFLFTKLRYYFLDKHPLGLSRAMQEQQNRVPLGPGVRVLDLRLICILPASRQEAEGTTPGGGGPGLVGGRGASSFLSMEDGGLGLLALGYHCVQTALARRTAGSQGPHSHPSRGPRCPSFVYQR